MPWSVESVQAVHAGGVCPFLAGGTVAMLSVGASVEPLFLLQALSVV